MIKKFKELFYHCQGNCKICFIEGGCELENKIKKIGIHKVKKEVYND
jgi:hypothetical protein